MSKEETNILKALAIATVVILHFNVFLFSRFPVSSFNWNIILLVDQIARFCVPLFVALSGYSLAKKYLTVPFSLKDFYLRRVTKLLPSYIIWSLVIYLGLHLAFSASPNLDPKNLADLLIWGKADYQLYFVPMIFQLYILFPVLYFLTKKFGWLMLVVSLAVQSIAFQYYFPAPDQEQYRMVITWIFYFVLGIYLAQKDFFLAKNKVLFILSIFLILAGFAWGQWDVANNLGKGLNLIFVTKTARLPIIVYATGFILAGPFLAKRLTALPKKLVSFLIFVGIQSYLIYLGHTLFLRLIFSKIAPEVNQGNVFVIALAIEVGIFLTILSGVFKKLPAFKSFGKK